MIEAVRSAELDPVCPRCDYDLSGDTNNWEVECPLEGRCPECGLEFEWRAVLGRGGMPPNWSVERAGIPLGRTAPKTFIRALLPHRFWSAMPMGAPGSMRRVALYAIGAAILIIAGAGVLEFSIDVTVGRTHQQLSYGFLTPSLDAYAVCLLDDMTSPFGMYSWATKLGNTRHVHRDLVLPALFVAAWPVVYLALPITLRRCRVKRVHLVRASLYALVWGALWCEGLYFAYLMWETAYYSNAWGLSVHHSIESAIDAGVPWILALGASQTVWWHAVNKRYLKLESAGLITASTLVIAGLATLIPLLAFTMTGQFLMSWLGLD